MIRAKLAASMNHDTYDDDYIAGILADHKRFAFVGASNNNSRPSYFAMKYLLAKGFTVVPVNPGRPRTSSNSSVTLP